MSSSQERLDTGSGDTGLQLAAKKEARAFVSLAAITHLTSQVLLLGGNRTSPLSMVCVYGIEGRARTVRYLDPLPLPLPRACLAPC